VRLRGFDGTDAVIPQTITDTVALFNELVQVTRDGGNVITGVSIGTDQTGATVKIGPYTLPALPPTIPGSTLTSDPLGNLSWFAPRGVNNSLSVFGATGITNSGSTTVNKDIGVITGGVTASTSLVVQGVTHVNDLIAQQAQDDLKASIISYQNRTRDYASFSGDAIGLTWQPGVRRVTGAFALTGTLTLQGTGDLSEVFIIIADAALNTASSSIVQLVNVQASQVFWVVHGAAGIGDGATFQGTIMCEQAITLGGGATLYGRALSLTSVTLADNTIITLNANELAAPVIQSVAAGNGQAVVTFRSTNPAGTQFRFDAVPAAVGVPQFYTSTTTLTTGQNYKPFTMTGLTNGTLYTITVTATNGTSETSSSNSASFTPSPPSITSFTFTADGSSMTVLFANLPADAVPSKSTGQLRGGTSAEGYGSDIPDTSSATFQAAGANRWTASLASNPPQSYMAPFSLSIDLYGTDYYIESVGANQGWVVTS